MILVTSEDGKLGLDPISSGMVLYLPTVVYARSQNAYWFQLSLRGSSRTLADEVGKGEGTFGLNYVGEGYGNVDAGGLAYTRKGSVYLENRRIVRLDRRIASTPCSSRSIRLFNSDPVTPCSCHSGPEAPMKGLRKIVWPFPQ